jgi:hypothetical protein
MAKKVAEMKRIMEFSTEFIDNADIEAGVNQDKGMTLLDEYEKRLSILSTPFEPNPQQSLGHAVIPSIATTTKTPANSTKSGSEWD